MFMAAGGTRADVADVDTGAGDRPFRLSAGLGWSAAILGPPTHGPVGYAAVLPGGPLDRFGIHAEVRGLDGTSPRWVLGGLTYEAGAARPHLKVELRAEGGAVLSERRPIAGGGARWHIWLMGPAALGIDGAAHLWIDGVDSELVLSGAFTLSLAL